MTLDTSTQAPGCDVLRFSKYKSNQPLLPCLSRVDKYKNLFQLLQPILQHKMLMMFQLCQVMVMISFSSSITLLASDQLHPAEGKSNLATYLIKNNLLYYFVFTVIYIQIRSVRSYNYTASLLNFSTHLIKTKCQDHCTFFSTGLLGYKYQYHNYLFIATIKSYLLYGYKYQYKLSCVLESKKNIEIEYYKRIKTKKKWFYFHFCYSIYCRKK